MRRPVLPAGTPTPGDRADLHTPGAPPAHARLRVLVFVGFAIWIVVGPGIEPILGLHVPWLRTWRMYSGSGRDTCAVSFFERTAGGDRPLEILSEGSDWWRLQPHQRRITKSTLPRTARALCAREGLRDVRADASCGTSQGWRVHLQRERNRGRGGPALSRPSVATERAPLQVARVVKPHSPAGVRAGTYGGRGAGTHPGLLR